MLTRRQKALGHNVKYCIFDTQALGHNVKYCVFDTQALGHNVKYDDSGSKDLSKRTKKMKKLRRVALFTIETSIVWRVFDENVETSGKKGRVFGVSMI